MNDIHMAVQMTFSSSEPTTNEDFEAFLDEVMKQFDNIGRSVDLAARLTDRFADFASHTTAADFETAAIGFLGDLRTALHAAGCRTPEWPRFTATDRVVRELQDA